MIKNLMMIHKFLKLKNQNTFQQRKVDSIQNIEEATEVI